MKHLILFIGLIIGSTCTAQNPVGAIESLELNTLYRGYSNKVLPAVTNNNGLEVELIGTNVSIEKVENRDYYLVVPLAGRYASLSVVLTDGTSSEVIKTTEYRVSNLPDPSIYWGTIETGGRANIHAQKFYLKYPPEVPLFAQFDVLSWEISYDNDAVIGTGANISSAEEFLKKIPTNATVLVELKVKGADGIIRFRKAQWTVTSWEEETELSPVGFE